MRQETPGRCFRKRKAEELAAEPASICWLLLNLKRRGGSVNEVAASFRLDARKPGADAGLSRQSGQITPVPRALGIGSSLNASARRDCELAQEFQALLINVIRGQAEIQEDKPGLLKKSAARLTVSCALPPMQFVLQGRSSWSTSYRADGRQRSLASSSSSLRFVS